MSDMLSSLLAVVTLAHSLQADAAHLQNADVLVAKGQSQRAAIVYAAIVRGSCASPHRRGESEAFNEEYAFAQLLAIQARLPAMKRLIPNGCRLPAKFAEPYARGIKLLLAKRLRDAFSSYRETFQHDTGYVPVNPKNRDDQPFGGIYLGLTQGGEGDYLRATRFFANAVRDSESESVNTSLFFLAQAQFALNNIASCRRSLAEAIYPRSASTQFPAITSAERAAAYELQFVQR